ncbi:MAG: hypothetical protein AAGJ46_07985 [Planctomycetota bacterium]
MIASSWLRWRLRLVYWLTGHPRFKPLYRADAVSFDPLLQAAFLADGGYHVAAVMMARATLEHRVKRLCLLSPNWRSCRRGSFSSYVRFLQLGGYFSDKQASRANRCYQMASSAAHGKGIDHKRCGEIVGDAWEVARVLKHATRQFLADRQEGEIPNEAPSASSLYTQLGASPCL